MYILYSASTSETGKALVEALGVTGGTRPPTEREDILVRWGNSENVQRKPGKVINKRDAIKLATDKLAALLTFHTRGVPAPKTWRANETIYDFPVLGRNTNHTQGRDVRLCLQPLDVEQAIREGCSHFTKLLPKLKEYRVHCFGGEVIKISEKVLTNAENYNPVVWNFDAGFTFRQPQDLTVAMTNTLNRVALMAIEVMGLDFGAADIIHSTDGGVYVLEVNTGPSLAEQSLDVYTAKILGLLPQIEG